MNEMAGSGQAVEGFEAHRYVDIELRHVLTNTGSIVTHKAEVSTEAKVGALKADFCHLFACPASSLKWILHNQTLENDKTLGDYEISDDKTAIINVKRDS